MSLLESTPIRPARSTQQSPVDTAELRRITREYARRPDLWAPHVRYATADHWSQRIHVDGDLDVWLITWLQQQSTTLHDHGRSAGESRSFGAGYVHDVYNPHPEPAFSIHAYCPPLTEMSYYSIGPGGGLEFERTLVTDLPIN